MTSLLPALAIGGCAPAIDIVNRYCEDGNFLLDSQFESGNFHACQVTTNGAFELTIRPKWVAAQELLTAT